MKSAKGSDASRQTNQEQKPLGDIPGWPSPPNRSCVTQECPPSRGRFARPFRSLVALSFAACGTLSLGQAPPATIAPQTPAAQSTTAPVAAGSGLKVRGPEAVAQADPNRIVATVAGKQLTAAQVMDLLRPLNPQDRQRYASNLQVLVQQVYMEERLADEATQLKLDQQTPWKGQLDLARANILTQAYLNHLSTNPTSTTPSQDPQTYFAAHPDEFVQCKISGILIGFTPPGTPAANGAVSRTESDAHEKADDIEKKIKAGGDLAALARTDSDNQQSAGQGGNLGTITMGDANIPATIKTAVAKLEPGQVSEPVRVQAGFYIIKLDSRAKLTLDQARPQIVQRFQAERSQAILKQEMDKYKLDVQDPDFFNSSTGPKLPSLQRLAPNQPTSPTPPAKP